MDLTSSERRFMRRNNLSVKVLVKAIAEYIRDAAPREEGDESDDSVIDIRLQIHEGWSLHTGDSSFDQDHRGVWGSSSYDSESNATDIAKELLDQALEQWATRGVECGG